MKVIASLLIACVFVAGCASEQTSTTVKSEIDTTPVKSSSAATAKSEAKAKAKAKSDPVPQPDMKVLYKTIGKTQLNMHVFLPKTSNATEKRPAILFYFGGGWNGGSPAQFYRQSEYLASRGMVAVAAEYRVKNRDKTTPKEAVTDAKSAMRWLKANAAQFNIDPDKIVASGGSAGGHLAAALATVTKFDDPTDNLNIDTTPSALALFNPVYDNSKAGYGFDRVKNYWHDFSPLHNLTKDVPPTIVFLGTNDHLIPVATAELFRDKMQALGIRSELYLYKGGKHGFFNYKSKKNFTDTLYKLDVFLTSLGYLEGQPTLNVSK